MQLKRTKSSVAERSSEVLAKFQQLQAREELLSAEAKSTRQQLKPTHKP